MYTWSKDLETGNAMIDTQHQQWIQALNKLLDACSNGQGRNSIQDTLRFLQEYTAKHFSDEEALQLKAHYPGYVQHRQYHDTFKKMVQDAVSEFEKSGSTIVLVGKVNNILGSWFLNHIKKEDGKVAACVHKAG